jgi:hypothetical protein
MLNRKTGVIIAIIAVLALASILLIPQGPRIVNLTDLVPDNAVIYLQLNNSSQSFEDFKGTSFYKQVSESDLWQRIITDPKIGQKLAFISEIKQILSKQYVLAGFENDRKQLTFLHIARIGLGQKVKQDVIKLFLNKNAKVDLKTVNYKGTKLTTVKTDNFSAIYAVVSDCLIVCEDATILKKAIDLGFLRVKNSLNTSARFINIIKRIPDKNSFLWGWLDYNAQNNIQRLVSKQVAENTSVVSNGLPDIQQVFSDVCWQVSFGKDIKIDVISIIDQEKLAVETPASRMIKAFIDQQTSGQIVSFFPANALIFFNYGFRDAILGYDYFKYAVAQAPSTSFFENFHNSVNKIEEKWGINIERELVPYLGKEVSFGLLDIIKGPKGLPIPGVLFALEIKDVDKFQNTIESIYNKAVNDANVVLSGNSADSKGKSSLDKAQDVIKKTEAEPIVEPKFIMASEDYKGIKINFIQEKDEENAGAVKPNLPGFAIKGKFFLASASTEQIKNAIDLFDSQESNFKSHAGLNNIDNDFTKNDFLFYLDSRGLADKLTPIFGSFMKINPQISEIANIIRAIKSISARGAYGSEEFVLKAKVDLGD